MCVCVCVCVYNKCKVYQRLPVQEPKIGSRVIRKSWPLLEGHQHAVKKTNTHPVGSLMAAKVSHMSHKGQWMSKIKKKQSDTEADENQTLLAHPNNTTHMWVDRKIEDKDTLTHRGDGSQR